MADKCLCHAYFEGVYDKQIKQGQDFDLAQGVRAIDGYGNEVDFTYEPTEIDLCKTGDQEVTYKAFGASFNVVPKLCMPKYKRGVSIPEACSSDLEMITAKRIIRIIRASNPRFLGIPRVFINENVAFDPTEGVTAIDDNGNVIDFSYEGKYDLVAEGDDITTFETEYEQNAKAVNVALEPIQDLHGYDKPWSGGSGKNKIGTLSTQTINGVTVTNNGDGSYTIDGTATVLTQIQFDMVAPLGSDTYTVTLNNPSTNSRGRVQPMNGGSALTTNITFSEANRTAVINAKNGIDAIVLVLLKDAVFSNFIFKPQIELGSTATSFEPYSNICPIEGHKEVVTHRTGKNLFDANNATIYNRFIYKDLNVWRAVTDGSASIAFYCKPNTTYTVSYDNSAVTFFRTALIDTEPASVIANDQPITSANGALSAHTVTTNSDTVAILIQINRSVLTSGNANIQIEYGPTATDYEPYESETYTTTLGRTVYGGTLDVVSGELVVDRAMVDIGDLVWNGTPPNFYTTRLNPMYPWASDIGLMCTKYANEGYSYASPWYGSNGSIKYYYNRGGQPIGEFYIHDESFTTSASFTEGNRGQKIVYKLANPRSIQLTPQQVELLKGTNNVWSDEGDVIVIYEGNIPQDGSFEYPLEGEYTITYKATDKCGNVGTAERTIVVSPSE